MAHKNGFIWLDNIETFLWSLFPHVHMTEFPDNQQSKMLKKQKTENRIILRWDQNKNIFFPFRYLFMKWTITKKVLSTLKISYAHRS